MVGSRASWMMRRLRSARIDHRVQAALGEFVLAQVDACVVGAG